MNLNEIRILHITNNLGYGGVQKIIFQLCNVTKKVFPTIKVASTGGVYVDMLGEIGINHILIPDISNMNLLNIFKTLAILKNMVKEYGINVIHCHHRMAVFYAKMIPGNPRIIYNNHTIYSDKPTLSRYVLRNVPIIADGQQAKCNVTNFFKIPKANVTIINNAVDADDGFYSEINEIAVRKKRGDFIVVNSSRIHPQKGMQYYVEAAALLIKKGVHITFFIVGDGPLKDEIETIVKDKHLQEHMFFLGYRKDIKNVIKQCDLLVLTSVYEGLPLTPMEAFSVKKAVVATDIDGTREVVLNGYNGLLAISKDPIDISLKIEELYNNRYKLSKLAEQAYLTYNNKFSLIPFTQAYLNFYSKL